MSGPQVLGRLCRRRPLAAEAVDHVGECRRDQPEVDLGEPLGLDDQQRLVGVEHRPQQGLGALPCSWGQLSADPLDGHQVVVHQRSDHAGGLVPQGDQEHDAQDPGCSLAQHCAAVVNELHSVSPPKIPFGDIPQVFRLVSIISYFICTCQVKYCGPPPIKEGTGKKYGIMVLIWPSAQIRS